MFKIAVNDPAERSFGEITVQIQSYDKIGLTNSGGVGQVRVNSDLSRRFYNGCKNKNTKRLDGIFHNLSEEMKVSLVKMCIYNAPTARAANQLALSKQQTS